MALEPAVFYGLRFDQRKNSPVCFLKASGAERFLPLWLSEAAASCIERIVHGLETPPDLLADPLAQRIAQLDDKFVQLEISAIEERQYVAHVVMQQARSEERIRCAASRGVALALLHGASLLVEGDLMYYIGFEPAPAPLD